MGWLVMLLRASPAQVVVVVVQFDPTAEKLAFCTSIPPFFSVLFFSRPCGAHT